VTNTSKYADYDVMSTPGLAIIEKTVSNGRIPSIAEITSFVNTALTARFDRTIIHHLRDFQPEG
jgi:hypothetical protein